MSMLYNMSEKITDTLMLGIYNEIFGHYYHTENNKELFNSLVPDGWDVLDDVLIIIENKRDIKNKTNAEKQIEKYMNNVKREFKNIYLIIGFGDNKTFKYFIYDKKFNVLNITMEDLKQTLSYNTDFDVSNIHKVNQYIYDHGINIPKSQKTLFVASVLLCLKINKNFIKEIVDDPSVIIADKMIDIIRQYYHDDTFANSFGFLKSSFNNKYLLDIFKMLDVDVKSFGKDILNMFYNEFLHYDKNNEGKLGIVLTPHEIVTMMIKELDIKETDNVLDFCTGSGSFLLEASKYTVNIYGCENNDERYSLAKCNFILNDINYENLHYNSCFNEPYTNMFDKIIINPPFKCRSYDEGNKLNDCHWKSYTYEQRFILYAVELLKQNGKAAIIVPKNNFNNNLKNTNMFKAELMKHAKINKIINLNDKIFMPEAAVACVIVILERHESEDEQQEIISVDLRDDMWKVVNGYSEKIKDGQKREKTEIIKYTDDWRWKEDETQDENEYIINIRLKHAKRIIEKLTSKIFYNLSNNNKTKEIFEQLKMMSTLFDNTTWNEFDNLKLITENVKFKEYKLGDIFERVKQSKTYIIRDSVDGDVALISRGSQNNGIVKYIKPDDDDTLNNMFTIAHTGTTGTCLFHNYEFRTTGSVSVFKLKNKANFNNEILASIITEKLTKKYDYTNTISLDKLLNETILYPF